MPFSVDLLPMGTAEVPGPELFWMSDWDLWHPLLFQAVLIRGHGVTALVNTGPALDLGPMNRHWVAMLGDRAPLSREPGQFIVDALAAHGVTPGDVTHVILTPLQLYTVSNLLLFDRAQICLSERGWTHFHTTHDHPHDNRSTSLPDEVLVHLVTDAWPRVRLLEPEDEIVPGLRTWDCGVHHRASLVVEAETVRAWSPSPTPTSTSRTSSGRTRSGSPRASLRRKPPTPASVAPLTSSCRSTTRRTWNDSPTGCRPAGGQRNRPGDDPVAVFTRRLRWLAEWNPQRSAMEASERSDERSSASACRSRTCCSASWGENPRREVK